MNISKPTAAVSFLAAAALALSACTSTSETPAGAKYPELGKNLTILLPVAAGGTTDNVARVIAPKLAEELGIKVQVVNKPGAAQQLGLTQLAGSPADGYTVGFTNLPSMISGYQNQDRGATYTRASYTPVAGVAATNTVVAVKADSKVTTLDDLFKAAGAGRITAGVTGGALGDDDLIIRKIQKAGSVTFGQVPFDSGTDKTIALLGGKVDFIVGSVSTVLPQVKTNELRMVALLAAEPDPTIPDVPTTGDLGIDAQAVLTISGPANMPAEATTKLEAALQKVLQDKTVQDKIATSGCLPKFVSAKDTAAFWEANDPKVKALIEEAQAS